MAEGLALARETLAASVSDVWAQRPDDLVVRVSDPMGYSHAHTAIDHQVTLQSCLSSGPSCRLIFVVLIMVK